MNTPICDFVRDYCKKDALRMHMPGHKGKSMLGMEALDITEIPGADSLYCDSGIIAESERNASALFGTQSTLYSTEGSSQCIRAMLYLICLFAGMQNKKPVILACRNVHKTFVTAASVLGFDTEWLPCTEKTPYLSCPVPSDGFLQEQIDKYHPVAFYVTSPDYLGNTADIGRIARICHKNNVLLAVDNAHGAYLKFLPVSRHPIDLGADMCCDSAHKTLPALTGAAYLHLSDSLPKELVSKAKYAMALFGSTSPSYLILQSLDAVNPYLCDTFRRKLADFLPVCAELKQRLCKLGYRFIGDEPLKWTVDARKAGYTGIGFSELLQKKNIVCEFEDPDFTVMMFSPDTLSLRRLYNAMSEIKLKSPITENPCPDMHIPARKMKISETLYRQSNIIPVEKAEGCVLAAVEVSCPPAVPIAVSGEIIDRQCIEMFRYYGITHCEVL